MEGRLCGWSLEASLEAGAVSGDCNVTLLGPQSSGDNFVANKVVVYLSITIERLIL